MEYVESILDLVGNTPLVRLSKVTEGLRPLILAKLEQLNPGGSVKDRIGLAMLEDAERRGLLRPGGTIVEPTSGNTGHGLAMAAAIKGYKMIFVMPDKMSAEKISLLRAYGAEVVICPTNVDRDSPQSYYSVADRLTREMPGAFQPNQYFNARNPEAHYRTTGPEIWRQTDGRITTFVAGVGTGGTISGVGKYLKEQNPAVRIVGADPEGSIYSGDDRAVQGRGRRRGLLAGHLRPRRRRRVHPGHRPRVLRGRAKARAPGGHPRRRLGGPRAPRGDPGRRRFQARRRDRRAAARTPGATT